MFGDVNGADVNGEMLMAGMVMRLCRFPCGKPLAFRPVCNLFGG